MICWVILSEYGDSGACIQKCSRSGYLSSKLEDGRLDTCSIRDPDLTLIKFQAIVVRGNGVWDVLLNCGREEEVFVALGKTGPPVIL